MTWSEAFVAWLARVGKTPAGFALEHRISPSKVHYWTKGSRPREDMRLRVQELSDGEISADLPQKIAPESGLSLPVAADSTPATGTE